MEDCNTGHLWTLGNTVLQCGQKNRLETRMGLVLTRGLGSGTLLPIYHQPASLRSRLAGSVEGTQGGSVLVGSILANAAFTQHSLSASGNVSNV